MMIESPSTAASDDIEMEVLLLIIIGVSRSPS